MLEYIELQHGTNCVSVDGCLPSEGEVCSGCSRRERQMVCESSLVCLRQVFYHRCCFRRGSNVTEGVSHAGLNSLDERGKRVGKIDTTTKLFVPLVPYLKVRDELQFE
jgi:hypothetical protein